eukprot:m51a1_g9566 hypothetical protein (149) ;mRNA; r:914730-915533
MFKRPVGTVNALVALIALELAAVTLADRVVSGYTPRSLSAPVALQVAAHVSGKSSAVVTGVVSVPEETTPTATHQKPIDKARDPQAATSSCASSTTAAEVSEVITETTRRRHVHALRTHKATTQALRRTRTTGDPQSATAAKEAWKST